MADMRKVRADLPVELSVAASDFERYLRLERDRSEHTVRAYVGDVVSLLDHARRLGVVSVAELELATLRSWLARRRSTGAARSSLARQAASARAFTGWARRTGRAETDPGELLISPRPHRTLPTILAADEAIALIEGPHTTAAARPGRGHGGAMKTSTEVAAGPPGDRAGDGEDAATDRTVAGRPCRRAAGPNGG